MTSENNYHTELIEKYLSGTLDDTQRKEVEARLRTETEFAQEVNVQRQIREASFIAGREQLKKKLKQIHQDVENNLPIEEPTGYGPQRKSHIRRLINSNKYLLVAATITILIIATFVTLEVDFGNDRQAVFQEYFEPYPNLASIQYRDENVGEDDYEKAFASYDAGNWEQSIDLFTKLLAKEKDEVVLFYLGCAYLSAGESKNAAKVFSEYINEYDEFDSEARWYLGLAYLKDGKEDEARKLFEELSKTKSDFTEKALQILKEIN